jgi:hypothetical protein
VSGVWRHALCKARQIDFQLPTGAQRVLQQALRQLKLLAFALQIFFFAQRPAFAVVSKKKKK